jgi:hypothetical protein
MWEILTLTRIEARIGREGWTRGRMRIRRRRMRIWEYGNEDM